MNDSGADKKPRGAWMAWAIFALGAGLRFFGLGDRQLWLDEIVQLRRFSEGGLIDSVLNLRLEIAAAPLDYVIQNAVVRVAGGGEWAARLHAAFFGCLALPVFFALCRRLFPGRTALTATLLLAVSPIHIWYSREGRGYSLFFLLTVAGYYTLWNALEKGGPGRWTLYGLNLTLCLYANYLGVAVVAAQAVFVALRLASEGRTPGASNRVAGFAVSAGAALLLFSPWAVYTSASARGDVGSVFLEGGLWLRLFKEISGGGYPLSSLLCVCFLFGALGLWRIGDRIRLGLLLSWFAVPAVLALALVWWRGYIFAIRQVLVCVAPLLAGAGVGLTFGRFRSDRRRAPAIVLIVAVSLGAVWLRRGKEEADWKGLVGYLSRLEPDVAIVAPHIEYALSHYLVDLPDRALPLVAEELGARLCGRPGSVAALVESRYMDASQSAEADRTKTLLSVVGGESFNGFRVDLLACLPSDRGRP